MSAKIISKVTVFEDHHKLDVIEFETKSLQHDGYIAKTTREVFYSNPVAVILLYNPITDEIVFSKQFRIVPFLLDDEEPFLLECAGGIVDAGETPEEAAKREGFEETGCKVHDIKYVGNFYPSPGCLAEKMHLYVGKVGTVKIGHFGILEEGEEIETHLIKTDDALHLLDTGKIKNAMTAVLLQWFARHRDSLRAEWS